MTKSHYVSFRKTVLEFYKKHGRSHLPWRMTHDPYAIMVSEIMLQQTQVLRVTPYFEKWMLSYPTVQHLAAAPLSDVLRAWSGLGYNRRARFLHEAARTLVREHKGVVPRSYEALRTLPGVGDYTARAVRVFAYNEADVLMETNVRTVLIHHFFSRSRDVSDTTLKVLAEKLAHGQDPRTWHSALMDYGTHLKETVGNVSRRARAYKKQPALKGSLREARGAILKQATKGGVTEAALKKVLALHIRNNIAPALAALVDEGFLVRRGRSYLVA